MTRTVIIYTTLPKVGGNSGVCYSLSKFLICNGFDVEIWIIEPPGEETNDSLRTTFDEMGVSYKRAPRITRGLIPRSQQMYFGLRSILMRNKPVFFISIGMNKASSLLCHLVNAKNSIYYCINHSSENAFLHHLASLGRYFNNVVLIANNTLSELSPRIDQSLMRKFTTIPQFTEFARGKHFWNDSSKSERLKIVFMGALKSSKGILEIAANWSKNVPARSDLHIYGDGPQRSEIEAICQLSLDNRISQETSRVIFHGSYSLAQRETSLLEILKDADLLILPSRIAGEGMPTVILEALCAGVPVVATCYGGVGSFTTRYYADLPVGIKLCNNATFMETVCRAISDISEGRVNRVELRDFYHRHFSDDRIESKWKSVLGGERICEPTQNNCGK